MPGPLLHGYARLGRDLRFAYLETAFDWLTSAGIAIEAIVAQELLVRGYAPHYYSSKKHGEVDFVIEHSMTGETRLIEVKSGKDYHRHSALTGLLKSGAAKSAVVLHDGNLEVEGNRVYAPIYAAHLVMRL